ncbi:MAG: RNA polymerase factor sigma-54 [[Eubacterium] sulci]|nr:RNA polymerase factor sigma-54 [[Eubacterium] sulci]MBF1153367.1 RNA polymerase factor sigma-54 [[Eubacterium] sulci]MBF1168303.1 RNA polymerase factor sigma-54 [[Eubacterium] sulci]MBF1172217.1 RNA polymerase factor sigma-54 [[Eubacterium] sulci]MBF1189654.1 RNA polymerase factor sigma-54 [[Eubacterium] sulci]
MKIGYELTIEQTQKLSMTPELIQAIQILQYNNQELNEYIDKELLENPILESEYHKESDTEIDIDSLRDQLIQADENVEAYKQWESHSTSDEYSYENFVAFNYTLTEFLIEQLHFSSLKGQDAEIGRYIIENIDDNGYLSMSLEEICSVLDVDLDSCERVLDLIHTFEPSGVGARDLNECLIIQLASLGELTDEIEFIISNRLKDLADNKYALISKEVGISLTEVQEIADLIKTLEPKPGRGFDSDNSIKYILPDIYVEETNGEYIVSANDGSTPSLHISSYYNSLTEEAKSDKELSNYLNNRFNSAMWLMKSIEQRKKTIYNVASAIVQFQNDFFAKGERFLKPLTLKQIAETVGVHESTVSRAINGKYMQCPRGVFELKYFFTGGILNEDGSGVSSNSIKSMIKEFVDAEDDKKPLSDSKISEMLHEKGIDISRRTVAKYRDDIGILPSSKRRRF